MARVQTIRFKRHQSTIPENIQAEWEAEIRAWDALPSKKGRKSPYREPVSSK
jgi:hypothetical protein